MSQNARILARLKAGPMCSFEPFDWEPSIRRPAARIQDLKDRGQPIEAIPCVHTPPTAAHVRYMLVTADQLELFL
jgi:hypothetical protein